MRLLKECSDGKFRLTRDLVTDIPGYAILSHTWGPDTEEVSYRDIVDGTGNDKKGYEKIKFCAEQARHDGLQYFWVDTCCINKSDNTELSTAIISMFRWYQSAVRCYVYLSDVPVSGDERDSSQPEPAWEPAFRASKWFTRGWTLQELLAPASVEFFSKDGRRLGDKRSHENQIHEITGIAPLALQGGTLEQFEVLERFKWAETRQTTREEDLAYCLLGIFSISMPILYGEGKEAAQRRLRKEIAEAANPRPLRAGNHAWMVTFERNELFTGRDSELKKLRQALFGGQRTTKVAVFGLGGVGKTQLVLEMVYRMREEDENCSVLWIPAVSRESLEQAYLNAAKELGIPGWDTDKVDAKKLVQDHLSNESVGRWLLVFDNADDVSMWTGESKLESSRLIDCLPRSRHGSIVFTTRDKKTAVNLARTNMIEMSKMDEVGGKQLLQKYLYDKDLLCDQEVTTLLTQLTYLPLAIVQAAMYMNENGISISDYLSLLDEQEEDVIDLLSQDFEDEWRYDGVKNPVATTWLISFKQVKHRDPLAADYLAFMACIDSKDIPQSLLLPGPSRKKETDAIGTLQGYSFITKRSTDCAGSAINIHRLVHLATRNWLRNEGLLPSWTGIVILRLADVLRNADENNREVWRPYMPHAYYTLESSLGIEDNEDILLLLQGYGTCLNFDGRYNEAKAPLKKVMEAYKTKLGPDHPDTLRSINNLALTLWYQGRWEEAEKLQVQVMEASKTKLGPDHPDTLTSMANLALTLKDQGRWEEAEKLEVQVMEASKTKLGPDHPDTLTSMANLASTLWNQGRLEEAEKLDVQVMEVRKTKLGPNHPITLRSMANLALTLKDQGRWEEAEKLQVQVIEARKTKLGPDHPNTLTSMANLASTLWNQGRWEEAEKLDVQVMEASKTKLGPDHPNTLASINNLAFTWRSQGRHADAIALMKDCVQARQRILGSKHPDTLSSVDALEEWS